MFKWFRRKPRNYADDPLYRTMQTALEIEVRMSVTLAQAHDKISALHREIGKHREFLTRLQFSDTLTEAQQKEIARLLK